MKHIASELSYSAFFSVCFWPSFYFWEARPVLLLYLSASFRQNDPDIRMCPVGRNSLSSNMKHLGGTSNWDTEKQGNTWEKHIGLIKDS